MKKLVISGLLFVLMLTLTTPLFSQDANRIVVLDFEVQSGNADYEYLGKGFAEFIAVALTANKGVTIIDREKRNDVIEEQMFSASGLADESEGVEIGNMLSANYLVSGSIFDMFGQLEVTFKLIDIEKGSAAATGQSSGEPREYKRMVAELTGLVVASLDTGTPAPSKPKPVVVVELDNDEADIVLASFSGAMDAVDRKDVAEAKEQLKTVQKVDKSNEAARYYLSKLFNASPKFNVELIFYAPSYNPAYLGFIEKDRMYLTINSNILPKTVEIPAAGDPKPVKWEVADGLYYSYTQLKAELGYYLPIGKNIGLGAEGSAGIVNNTASDFNYDFPFIDFMHDDPGLEYITTDVAAGGGRLSLGFRLHPAFAIGLSGFLYNYSINLGGSAYDIEDVSTNSNNLTGAASLGFFLRLLDGNLTIDGLASAAFIQEPYVDTTVTDYVAYNTAPYPGVVEANIIGKIADGRVFLSLKEILEIYLSFGTDDREGIASRTIPAIEWWPTDKLSLRLGGEYDFLSMNTEVNHGFGVLGGVSYRIGDFDIDANLTYMNRAFRFYPGCSAQDLTLLIQGSWNGAFIKERK